MRSKYVVDIFKILTNIKNFRENYGISDSLSIVCPEVLILKDPPVPNCPNTDLVSVKQCFTVKQ